eukprot:366242-Chlamydomonas_euryale.AAC.7
MTHSRHVCARACIKYPRAHTDWSQTQSYSANIDQSHIMRHEPHIGDCGLAQTAGDNPHGTY